VAQKRTIGYGVGYGSPSEMVGIVDAVIEKVRIGEVDAGEALQEVQGQLEEMLALWDEAQS